MQNGNTHREEQREQLALIRDAEQHRGKPRADPGQRDDADDDPRTRAHGDDLDRHDPGKLERLEH